MTYIQLTIVVPADQAPLARRLASHIAGPPGDGMWLTGLSANGQAPATHYVSSGPVGSEFEPILSDPAAMWEAAQDADGVTQPDCEALVASAEVVPLSDEGPFDTFSRLGLRLIAEG